MGATCRLDLTSDITHLIVGQIDTPKYKHVAKERPDIYVLKLEWVEAARQSWMEGGDPDIHALALEYRLPTFFGLHVCVTGFNDCTYKSGVGEFAALTCVKYNRDKT